MTQEEREENIKRDMERQETERQIADLKKLLADSDYKIIKCYEAGLTNEAMPYDTKSLISERQKLRDEINELQENML